VKPGTVKYALCSFVNKMDLNLINESESLTEFSCDTSLKIKFEALSLPEFWMYITLETLTTSHRVMCITFWNDMSAKKNKRFQQWQQLNGNTGTA
jgi:hypothetical protein